MKEVFNTPPKKLTGPDAKVAKLEKLKSQLEEKLENSTTGNIQGITEALGNIEEALVVARGDNPVAVDDKRITAYAIKNRTIQKATEEVSEPSEAATAVDAMDASVAVNIAHMNQIASGAVPVTGPFKNMAQANSVMATNINVLKELTAKV